MIIFSVKDEKETSDPKPTPFIVKNYQYKASAFPIFYKVQKIPGVLRNKTRQASMKEPLRTKRRQNSLFVLSSYQEFFKLKSRPNLNSSNRS